MGAPAVTHDELGHAVDRFLAYLRAERRYSPSTLDHYAHALGGLTAHAGRCGLARWRDYRADQAQSLLAELHRRHAYAPATLRGIASAWRSFFRWLAREGEVGANPAVGLRAPRLRRKLPQVLDTAEMAQLVAVAGDGPGAVA